jgi:transcriptional regulator with XRE-family HTH domain/UDP-2,3-diacylglucosamine pyrophosphatase LpxH
MPKLSDAEIAQIVQLRQQGKSQRDIAKELGISKGVVWKYLRKYNPYHTSTLDNNPDGPPPKGRPLNTIIDNTEGDGSIDILKLERPATPDELMELCHLDPTRWIAQAFRANCWQGFYKLKDGAGHRKVQLYQSRLSCKRVITEELEDAILAFIKENVVALPKPPLAELHEARQDGQLLVWGLWDAHIGMYAWNSTTRADWDVDIACNRIFNSIDSITSEIAPYNIKTTVMAIGNDFMHFDSVRNTTALGDHYLDIDTRFARVYLAALKCLIYMVERALEFSDEVRLLYLPGNHDTSVSFTLIAAIVQRFFNDPRVKADLSDNPRKIMLHGGSLIGFDHGAYSQPARLALNLLTEEPTLAGRAVYREMQIGHKHQKRETMFHGVTPTNGVLIRMNPSLCCADLWHHQRGFTDPVKTVEAWRYDENGCRGSHVASAYDARNPNLDKVRVVPGGANWKEGLSL